MNILTTHKRSIKIPYINTHPLNTFYHKTNNKYQKNISKLILTGDKTNVK
jgi:hypothetical protein